MTWANSRIRLTHFLPYDPREVKTEFENTDPEGCDQSMCKKTLKPSEFGQMTFNSSSTFF